ncbi:tripartite tricarboxylate transporter permease [Pararhodobacter sp. CCB-MM2]|uniref:tripartite tricarboxylate transporter permease n=1 Tax=Pararhodobacter sp. CCB-MM2 TaxID=1786003 RepID=UPI00082CF189|nr:tripartite tricarboxylate transporter permease [Pararhodobacter sp. CCB-MM2]MCA2012238.1 tripartite tricarboxylate transporter permease [Cereibacter sphaeroides]
MDYFASLWGNIVLGFGTASSLSNLMYCLIGVGMGTVVGIVPGLGSMAAISLLLPITFHIDPTSALIMLAGIWYGTTFGGSTASILLNLPGTASNAVTCLDGYPMTKQGRGAVALFMTTIASFFGGSIGIVLLMLLSPVIAGYALNFGSTEYFALMVMGLVVASSVSGGSFLKGMAMVLVGIAFGTVGLDIYTGAARFTGGSFHLADGIKLIALAMGLFGVAEIVSSIGLVRGRTKLPPVTMGAMLPTKDEARASVGPLLRGAGIGSFFGTLPGTGPSIAAFMAYAVEKARSRTPERFGNGAMEGIVAPESANNAADQTAFIPTLSLGIPGSATMALMLGALIMHGITPGPQLIVREPGLFWGLVMSFWIGNLLLLILNIPLIGVFVKILAVPYNILVPIVLTFICIGAYSVGQVATDVYMVLFFGLLGYGMRLLALPAAPLLLGFVLGPLMEEHFRRSMLIARGDAMTFLERPISATILAVTVAYLLWMAVAALRRRGQEATA